MVDWATVALSSTGSMAGILFMVLLERRRETLRFLEAAGHRLESMDGRVRSVEQEVVALRPANEFFTQLATGELKGKVRRVGGR